MKFISLKNLPDVKFRMPIMFLQIILVIACLMGVQNPALSASAIIEQSTLTGNIRSFFQTQDFDLKADVSVYSLGGRLKFESGSFKGWKVGTAFYFASDLGVNRDDLRRQNSLFPVSTLSTFGEAYLQYSNETTLVRFGRQKIDTPFLNPSDAHVAPVTFFGYRVENTSLENFKLIAIHVSEIKLRPNNSFQDTGQFVTRTLGVTPEDTTGTSIFGVVWEKDNLKVEGWDYYLPNLYNLIYFQGDIKFAEVSGVKTFLSVQAGKQFDVGENLTGGVDSSVFGVQLEAVAGPAKAGYAFNYLPENEGNFRNGGFLSPYSFATDVLYTNSIDGGLTSKSSAFVGAAHKLSISYDFSKAIWSKFSYTYFDLIQSVGGRDSREINVDVMYKFQGALKGLSLRNRLAFVESDIVAENLIENRLQLQYVFGNLFE